jgi:hypothetical protein
MGRRKEKDAQPRVMIITQNTKALLWGAGILTCIVLFMMVLSRRSHIGRVSDDIKNSTRVEEVRGIFEDNKETFKSNAGDEEAFLKAIRDKLASLNLSESEIADCKTWIPSSRQNLNLIIVPDLSNRIMDDINNPAQITNDTIILRYIWQAFEKATEAKTDSRDRLVVDVTDEGQAKGLFRTLANDLVFDLSEHSGKINRLYFKNSAVRDRYTNSIRKLYNLAKDAPLGADYWSYFRRNLSRHIQTPTIHDDYRNILILITDGYLEAQDKLHTGSLSARIPIASRIKNGYSVEDALGDLRIEDIHLRFPTLEVLILEVQERKRYSPQEPNDKGTSEDYDILQALWRDWFNRLEIKNANDDFFIFRSDRTIDTKNEIDRFILQRQ